MQIYSITEKQTDIKADIKIIKNDIAGIKENLKWMLPIFLANTGILLTLLIK